VLIQEHVDIPIVCRLNCADCFKYSNPWFGHLYGSSASLW
jgi:hypothetical protein